MGKSSNIRGANMTKPDAINDAQNLPSGTRFYRCALQVNPYEYLVRHSKITAYSNEADYNTAIVETCQRIGIEVIGITDHYRVRSSRSLRQSVQAAGIIVFPGFEAVSKDGVHLLCLFDPEKDEGSLERILGDCGIHEDESASPTGKYDAVEFLKESQGTWGSICIAAHVASEGGLLHRLSGQPRINAWTWPHLLSCALPGPVSDAPDSVRPIIQNKNPEYYRGRPVAVINAQDVSNPEDLEKPGASCWIKMSNVTLEGLRQAFLDPVSRIRLASDPAPEEHTELIAMTWQGGILDGAAIH